jgi:hypothetical protein
LEGRAATHIYLSVWILVEVETGCCRRKESRRWKEGIYALVVSTLLSCHWLQMVFECIGTG